MFNSSAPSAGDGSSKTTVVPATVTGSHLLEVKGFYATKGLLGVGKSIYSDVFSVAGHRWILQYYPDGFNEQSANHIAIFVNMKDPVAKEEVKARLRFSLIDLGRPVPRYTFTIIHTFSSTAASLGYRTFMETKDLEYSYLRDDSFQIKCDLTVIKDDICMETAAKDQALVLPPPDLQRHLGSLLASKVGGDIEFDVDGELFTAHRNVLAARSSVFMAEMFGPMQPKATDHGHLRIQDMEARLKLICEDMLHSSVDVSLAATTLVLAEQHGCQGLKSACFEFLRSPGNLKAVMATEGFQHMKSSCPSLLEELLAQVAP